VTRAKSLSQDFSKVPDYWQDARVRIGRRQGTSHILEVEFLDGPLEGKRLEARRLPLPTTRAEKRKLRIKHKRLRDSHRIPCKICGRLSCERADFCLSCSRRVLNRMRDLGLTKAEAVFMVMQEMVEMEKEK